MTTTTTVTTGWTRRRRTTTTTRRRRRRKIPRTNMWPDASVRGTHGLTPFSYLTLCRLTFNESIGPKRWTSQIWYRAHCVFRSSEEEPYSSNLRVEVFVCELLVSQDHLVGFIQQTIFSDQSHISEMVVIYHVSKGRLQGVG